MDEQPRWREAVRALVLDETDRVLLVRFEFPPHFVDSLVWAAPGGGVEGDEDDRSALQRELTEEVGSRHWPIGPLIWTRTHAMAMATGQAGQHERFYLVRTESFEPAPVLGEAQLRAEFVTGIRWWTLPELAGADTVFAPRALPELVSALLAQGPPAHPIDVGV